MDKRMTLQNDRVHATTTLTQAMASTTNGRTFIDWHRGGLQLWTDRGKLWKDSYVLIFYP